jgi:hypothetical protein
MSIELLSLDDIPNAPFVPYKVSKEYVRHIFSSSPEHVKDHARKLISLDWKIYAVDQDRGRCYYSHKVITIPVWVIKRGGTKLCWYACHEMAHALAPIRDNHGPVFMETLKSICPLDAIHHELGYKPRNAASAGIGFIEL